MGLSLSLENLTPTAHIDGPEAHIYQSRLMYLELVDNSGYSSDTLKITLSAEDLEHNIQKADKLSLQLGYKENPALYDMGTYSITKLTPLYFPKRIEVLATADELHINSPSKARRSESYTNITLKSLVTKIAGRMGLKSFVHASIENEVFVHIDQKNESDLSFCQRLASYKDAVAKSYDGTLIFAPRGSMNAQSASDLKPIELVLPSNRELARYNSLKSLSLQIPEKEQFLGVEGAYYDDEKADIVKVTLGDEPRASLAGRFSDEVEAKRAIGAEFSRIKRQSLKFSFSVPGNPELMAERVINITGAGNMADGLASCDSVRHVLIPSQSFTTHATASAVIKRA